MALTAAQEAQIRHYLGYDMKQLNTDPYQYAITSAIRELNEVGREEQLALVTNELTDSPPGLLARIYDIQTKLVASLENLDATKLGTIELNPAQIGLLRSEGRRAVVELANLIGVPVGRDVFSSAPRTKTNWVGK